MNSYPQWLWGFFKNFVRISIKQPGFNGKVRVFFFSWLRWSCVNSYARIARNFQDESEKHIPDAQCMVYLPTFTKKLIKRVVNMPYIEHLGISKQWIPKVGGSTHPLALPVRTHRISSCFVTRKGEATTATPPNWWPNHLPSPTAYNLHVSEGTLVGYIDLRTWIYIWQNAEKTHQVGEWSHDLNTWLRPRFHHYKTPKQKK